jgi:hypothetical protein
MGNQCEGTLIIGNRKLLIWKLHNVKSAMTPNMGVGH